MTMSDTVETNRAIDILGPQIEFKTEFSNDPQSYCVIASIIPAGVTVPLHSHDDRETFYITSGTLEVFDDQGWRTLDVGDIFDVPAGVRHALRNRWEHRVSALLVTTTVMAKFFAAVGRPVPVGPPSPEDLQAFVAAAMDQGYWLGSPQENAAIGIFLPNLAAKVKRPANMTH
jgi:quercetin dioxygenase-like cupin family protein